MAKPGWFPQSFLRKKNSSVSQEEGKSGGYGTGWGVTRPRSSCLTFWLLT